MTTYRRKQQHTIEAVQFTSEMGEALREGGYPADAPDGLSYSEHSGYSFHGVRIAFGDYMVGREVHAREAFEAEYEPVPESLIDEMHAVVVAERAAEIERRTAADLAAANVTLGTGSVAVDTALATKAKRRTRTTEGGE